MIDFSELTLAEIIFTHCHAGKQIHYAISKMTAAIPKAVEDGEIICALIPIEQEHAEWAIKNRGIEPHRLARLLKAPLPLMPLLYLEQDDGTHLLVDGNHRYVALAKRGITKAHAFLWKKEHNKRFAIENYPTALETPDEVLVNSFSGIG